MTKTITLFVTISLQLSLYAGAVLSYVSFPFAAADAHAM